MSMKATMALALLCAAPTLALAQSPSVDAPASTATAPATGKRWQACATEVQKFCASVEKGKGLIRSCLESHTSELSDGCKTSMAEHAARAKDKSK
jgi:hypothetical protein